MRNRNLNYVRGAYWTTQAWNKQAMDFFYSQLETLAMSRFRWEDLPPKCDQRYLEWCLLHYGVACIAWPEGFNPWNGFAMQAVTDSKPDANNNYPAWTALGANGVKFHCYRNVNGTIVWDSIRRTPITANLEFCAGELANIMRTTQTIRQHMRQPVIVSGAREMSQQLKALTAQISGGEPYIIVNDGFNAVETQVLPVGTGKEADELAALEKDRQDVWNMALQYLGISLNERKAERQTTTEIQQADQPSTLQGMGALMARRQACDALNALTGHHTRVYWNSDVESDSFNMVNNMATMLNANAVSQVMGAQASADSEEEKEDIDDDIE